MIAKDQGAAAGADGAFVVVPVSVELEQGRNHCDRGEAIAKHQNRKRAANRNRSRNAARSTRRANGKLNAPVRLPQGDVCVMVGDGLGMRMGACLEKMETFVDSLSHRLTLFRANELLLGALIVGVVFGLLIDYVDEILLFSVQGGVPIGKIAPWLLRGLWLSVCPLFLPDFIRAVGGAMGVKDPMRSSVVIVGSCALTLPLWMGVCEAVFVSLWKDMAGDML